MIYILGVAMVFAVVLFCYLFIFKPKFGLKTALLYLRDVFVINAISMPIIQVMLYFHRNHRIYPDYAVYAASIVVMGLGLLAVMLISGKKFGTIMLEKQKQKKGIIVLDIIIDIIFVLGLAAFTGTGWGKDVFGDVTPDQMIINMFSPTDGTSSDVINSLWTGPVLITAICAIVFSLLLFSRKKWIIKRNDKQYTVLPVFVKRIICALLAVSVLGVGVYYGVKEFRLVKLFKMYYVESDFIDDNFVDPRETKMIFPEKKRNLIHIYLESMENTYLSKDMGGYGSENLIAPLMELASEGYVFSDNAGKFGGPIATTGCSWSVASMVNMTTGLPMKTPVSGNSYGAPGEFLPGAVSLGDILNAQGYEQSLMFGASAKFGGLIYYYTDHGNYNIYDHDKAKELGWIPKDYKVWWGYEDDKLYEYAKKELIRLYETGKPFNFTMETADTHFPDGYVGKNTPRTRDSQYADVIAYSASEAAKFVNWIKEQPFYENTTIILIGDHLSMDENYFKEMDKSYKRTTFNVILNPAPSLGDIPEERFHNRWWFNCDMFPTTLAALGVKIEGERLGLGTNLFSDKDTIFEQYGGEEGWLMAQNEIELKSDYYNEVILSGELKPFDNKNITYYK